MKSKVKSAVIKFTGTRFKRIRFLLKSFATTQNTEIIHQIRIEIKKLKSILHLIDFFDKGFNYKKKYSPFRKIYRSAKCIREPLVMESLIKSNKIKKYSSLPDFNPAISSFIESIPVYLETVRKQKKLILKAVNKVSENKYRHYIKKENKKIRNSLFPSFIQGELHGTRMQIKEIIYLIAIMDKRNRYKTFLTDIAGRIGDWHDHTLLIEFLKKSHSLPEIKKLQTENRKRIAGLKEVIKSYYGKPKTS